MKTVEEFGNTVQEAREKAYRSLGIRAGDEGDVEVEVLSEGSPGNTAGWGRKLARIRASVAEQVPVPSPVRASVAERVQVPVRASVTERVQVPVEDPELDEDVDDGEDVMDAAHEVLQHILDLMDLRADVEERDQDGHQVLNIVGPDLAILIGKHGQTLEALQFVVNLIVNRNAVERSRIIVDVGGYRQRRERTLRELAQRMGRRAAQDQCEVALEPMQASERRIVHITLADDPEVETYSQGEEPMRKVIIAPRR